MKARRPGLLALATLLLLGRAPVGTAAEDLPPPANFARAENLGRVESLPRSENLTPPVNLARAENLAEAWNAALRVNPRLDATRWSASAAAEQLKASQAERLPAVSTLGGYQVRDHEPTFEFDLTPLGGFTFRSAT